MVPRLRKNYAKLAKKKRMKTYGRMKEKDFRNLLSYSIIAELTKSGTATIPKIGKLYITKNTLRIRNPVKNEDLGYSKLNVVRFKPYRSFKNLFLDWEANSETLDKQSTEDCE
eukprot:TRINITY_DN3463_c0_g1_i3.p1 TRINITY_DN3463_c0_g1~~TRINITY_DN3463_c0_g1_i3.p1  ORF type:complete len:113 (-),score=11.64 TRINITY_DN3463_c0_g1_i3:130-468(-)